MKLFDCDIRELTRDRIAAELGEDGSGLFAVAGGPPCQAFSTAGKRLGLNDERGNVFLHFIRLAIELRPKYLIFENVRGLLCAPLRHRPHSQRGNGNAPLRNEEKPGGALLEILKLLEVSGYCATFNLYNTANFGVPQVRERLIFLACRKGRSIPYLQPTHDREGRFGLKPWKTVRDAIWELKDSPCRAASFPENRRRYYALLREGQNWRDLPVGLQKEAMGDSFYSGGGRTGFFRKLAWEQPSPTLVTRPTMKATDLCHPLHDRPLSIEEYAALQTFPDGYKFCGKLDDQYRQIGNAVPCQFGAAIGSHLLHFDEGKLDDEGPAVPLSRYSGTDHKTWRKQVSQPDSVLLFAD